MIVPESKRAVELRPMVDADLGWSLALADWCGPGWLRVCGKGVPLPPQLMERMWSSVYAQFVAEAEETGPFAITALYDVAERHGTGWLDIATSVDDEEVEAGILTQMLHHAFDRCGLRKVYLRYPGWRVPVVDPSWSPEREALLDDHLLHDGIYWDVGVITVTRPEAP